jgi:NTE family protein
MTDFAAFRGGVEATRSGQAKTAFVFAGGGSFGSIQVGMLRALAAHGVTADMVVGSSVGAMNAAYYASNPTPEGIEKLAAIWRSLRRKDVFPITWRTLVGFIRRRDFVVSSEGLRHLIDTHIPYRNLEDARIPLHVVATDLLSGNTVVLSRGPLSQAIIASTAIPAVFAPVSFERMYLADGAITCNTPIRVAVARGARRLIVLPTGYACALEAPPRGAVACALHALDRASVAARIAWTRRRNRVLRCAAALSTDRIASRFLSHERADRARCREHPHLVGRRWPGSARNPSANAYAQTQSVNWVD